MENSNLLDRTTPPPASPLMKIAFPEIEELTLDNGIPVHYLHYGPDDLVVIYAVFNAGKGFEPQAGVAAMAASMLMEGTEKYNALQFAQTMDYYGVRMEVDSGYESVTVEMTSLSKHLDHSVPLMSELIRKATLPEEEFVKLKARTLQRLEVQEQKTNFVARKEFRKQIFGNDHPYGRVEGNPEVEALTVEHLRDYYHKHFALNNLFFIVAGRLSSERVLELLNPQFGEQDLSQLPPPPVSGSEGKSIAVNTGLHYVEMPDSMQASIRVGHAGFPRYHPDFEAMTVVNTILGGYFGSRFMRNIREDKGYTYGVGSAWLSLKNCGIYLVQTDVGNEYITDTLNQIRLETELLLEKGVDEAELQLVKNYMLGNLVSSRETPQQLARTVRSLLINQVPLSRLNDKFDAVQSITREDVLRLANQYYHPEKLVEVVAGKMLSSH